jgi:hypothetical protein
MARESLDHVISGALYDFGAYLTTRPEVLKVSEKHEAGPMAVVIKEFLELRGVSLTCEPQVMDWQYRCGPDQPNVRWVNVENPDLKVPDNFYNLEQCVAHVIALAKVMGKVVNITNEPLQPLAMGNHEMVETISDRKAY